MQIEENIHAHLACYYLQLLKNAMPKAQVLI